MLTITFSYIDKDGEIQKEDGFSYEEYKTVGLLNGAREDGKQEITENSIRREQGEWLRGAQAIIYKN